MNFILQLAVKFFLYVVFLFGLERLLKDVKLKKEGLISVAAILLLTDWLLGTLLNFLSWPFKAITLFLLSFLINWLINVVVIYVTDKLSDSLEIVSTKALLIAGAGLSMLHWIIALFLK